MNSEPEANETETPSEIDTGWHPDFTCGCGYEEASEKARSYTECPHCHTPRGQSRDTLITTVVHTASGTNESMDAQWGEIPSWTKAEGRRPRQTLRRYDCYDANQ